VFGGWRDQPMLLFQRVKNAVRYFEMVEEWRNKYTPTKALEDYWYATHKETMAFISFIQTNQLTGPLKDDLLAR